MNTPSFWRGVGAFLLCLFVIAAVAVGNMYTAWSLVEDMGLYGLAEEFLFRAGYAVDFIALILAVRHGYLVGMGRQVESTKPLWLCCIPIFFCWLFFCLPFAGKRPAAY